MLLQNRGDLAVHQVELNHGRAAHAVEHDDRRGSPEVEVAQNRLDQLFGDARGVGERHPVTTGLAVDTHADLHLVVGQVERRLAGRGHRATRQGHAHRAASAVDRLREGDELVEAAPLLGRGAHELLEQHREADPAATRGVERVLHGDVVVHDDRLHLDTGLHRGELGGHLEVHDVAGVVLHDVQHASAAVDLFRGRLHLVGRRRGEDLSGAGRVEHPEAHEPAVQRFVTRPAATHERDGAVVFRGRAVDDAIHVVDPLRGVRRLDALESIGEYRLGGVDQFLHRLYPSCFARVSFRPVLSVEV